MTIFEAILLFKDTTKNVTTPADNISMNQLVMGIIVLLLGGSGWIANWMKSKAKRIEDQEKAMRDRYAISQNQKHAITSKELEMDEQVLRHELENNANFQRDQTSKIFDKYVDLGDFFKNMYEKSVIKTNDLLRDELKQGADMYILIDVLRQDVHEKFRAVMEKIDEMNGKISMLGKHDSIKSAEDSILNVSKLTESIKNNIMDSVNLSNQINNPNES